MEMGKNKRAEVTESENTPANSEVFIFNLSHINP